MRVSRSRAGSSLTPLTSAPQPQTTQDASALGHALLCFPHPSGLPSQFPTSSLPAHNSASWQELTEPSLHRNCVWRVRPAEGV